jgi:uncharacterized membrane protein
MELDELKNSWKDIGDRIENQQKLNLKTFDKMSKIKFQVSLKKVLIPELLGSIICILGAVFIGFNFYRLNTIIYQTLGMASILLLAFLPVISLMSILPLYQSVDINKSYAETLSDFAVQKIKFCKLQKLNLVLSHLLLVLVIILLPKLFGKSNIIGNSYYYILSFSFGYIYLEFLSKKIFKSYSKTIRKSEDSLNELTD